MDDTGMAWWNNEFSMRWVLIHMTEDTARHADEDQRDYRLTRTGWLAA
jgi:uncharacterized protein DUF664